MDIDDDDDDFGFGDGAWDGDEARQEMEQHRDHVRRLPVMRKAGEVLRLTEAIVAVIDEEKDELQIREQMLANAFMLMPKIAAAESGDRYTPRMENAVVIKVHARELLAQTALVQAEKLASASDLQVLRDAVEEFRVLFVAWVRGFDKDNDIPDGWGLFHD